MTKTVEMKSTKVQTLGANIWACVWSRAKAVPRARGFVKVLCESARVNGTYNGKYMEDCKGDPVRL